MNGNNATNFGSGSSAVFNDENIYINIANALISGNGTASASFAAIATGSTLADQVTSIYRAFVPASLQTDAGLAFLIRPAGLAFYQQVAAERGITSANGAATVAFASLLKIAVTEDYTGIGDGVNDLINSINDGSSTLPETSATFIPIETVDGTNHDADDGGTLGIAFTTGADNLTGTAGNDVYTAILGPGATLNSTDTLNAGEGTDSLTVTAGAGTATLTTPTFTGLETLSFVGAGSVNVGLGKSTGLTEVHDKTTGDLTLTDVTSSTMIVADAGNLGSATITMAAGQTTLNMKLAGNGVDGAAGFNGLTVNSTAPVTINVDSTGANAINQLGTVTAPSGSTINISGAATIADNVSMTMVTQATVDASGLSAGLLYTGSANADKVTGGTQSNFIATGKGVDEIIITPSGTASDKISFEGIKTETDFNLVRGFTSGAQGDVISILASDTTAGTLAANPPVVQTVASKAAFTSFDTTTNDILELEFAFDSSGGAVSGLLSAIGTTGGLGGDGIAGRAGGSGYIVAYSTAGEALLFYAEDTIASASPVFGNSEIQFVGLLTDVATGSLTSANFDLSL